MTQAKAKRNQLKIKHFMRFMALIDLGLSCDIFLLFIVSCALGSQGLSTLKRDLVFVFFFFTVSLKLSKAGIWIAKCGPTSAQSSF